MTGWHVGRTQHAPLMLIAAVYESGYVADLGKEKFHISVASAFRVTCGCGLSHIHGHLFLLDLELLLAKYISVFIGSKKVSYKGYHVTCAKSYCLCLLPSST